jgi:hypothetical protein
MALTPQQQKFLDAYVRKSPLQGKAKAKRAAGFSALRDAVVQALGAAPPLLPQYPQLLAAMKSADALGDQLKFDRAAAAMQQVLADIQAARSTYRPPVDPAARQPADPAALAAVRQRHAAIAADPAWAAQQGRGSIGNDLRLMHTRAQAALTSARVDAGQLAKAQDMVDEMEVKLGFLKRRTGAIDKRRAQLRKYAGDIASDVQLLLGNEALVREAQRLAGLDTGRWTPAEETAATSAYLDMMLVLAGHDDVRHKDFKAGQKEMVMALRRKEKIKPGSTDGALVSNFKLIVKPADREIAVDGFKKGGGAPREAMGSVIGDKLQEMLGLELNVASTKLVQVDGGGLVTGDGPDGDKGYAKGQKLTASAQAFARDGATIGDLAEALLADADDPDFDLKSKKNATGARILDQQVSKEELHQLAVFDLIALHADRHCGNFLLGSDGKLVPIDHGNVMPTREGLRGRSAELGPQETVLAQTAAAQEKLAPHLAARVERLNIDELVATMRTAQQAMVQAHPGVDGADLEAGLANVRRSAEFMQFAVRQLTLEQIYDAYSTCQDYIFFSDETVKLEDFARAVQAVRDRADAVQRLEALTGQDLQSEDGPKGVVERLRLLGWLPYGGPKHPDYRSFVCRQPERCLQILERQLKSPVKPTDDESKLFKALGGPAAYARQGYAYKDGGLGDKARLLSVALATTGRMP